MTHRITIAQFECISCHQFCNLSNDLKEMEETMAYVVWILSICSLVNVKPVESSHFMGGIIQWRPENPAAFDGRVRTRL